MGLEAGGMAVRIENKGFTLIELMIVVAIIGLLAAFAGPLYQDYICASQVKRVHAEVSAYKSGVEEGLAKGRLSMTNQELGFVRSNLMATVSGDVASIRADGSVELQVVLGGSAFSRVSGVAIRLNRSIEGVWGCDIDSAGAAGWKDFYMPQGCN
jgi:type IV pilus assembly protein PilA